MEWLTFIMAATAFIFVFQEIEKRKKIEKRLQQLEEQQK
ncbi:hypothetical protein ABID52_001910 [Fictibacillus halophilus]|uniref:YrzO family protein n=1 Tax=Fictibacillus halophilus TaxID=1610490 RepID=A0ABV2LIE4_9BACL